ncbi:15-hydroxyprostaglandin dehydrogenase [NAD(+)]-like [Haliotis rufescens]|uniref:15-hydroxyprostaglandin dehydrogenase [NAD(+)]-like n=1 Tax=Haliotis rufescens TaxID=6454 RepID=UPI00201E9BF8|nr:15-hydroxyprostaglandin dehydrogenase [NAD(+)]-like [Haliotis rufescens]
MQLKDKVVFITGGAEGFGKAVAEAVLRKGAKVCVADVNVDLGEATAKELQASSRADSVLFVKCDVSDASVFEDAFKAAVSKFGHVDVMCNNAGILDERIWEKQLEINFGGVVRGTMMALNHMRKDKGGRGGVIINTASIGGLLPSFWFPTYAASKSAVYHFTASWAKNPDMKSADVRMVSICPSGAKTALLDMAEEKIINYEHFKQFMERSKYCRVDQVVEAFLLAMEDDTIHGTAITIKSKEGVEKMKMSLVPAE